MSRFDHGFRTPRSLDSGKELTAGHVKVNDLLTLTVEAGTS